MSIYEILIQDHKEIAKLLNEVKKLADTDLTYFNEKIKILYHKIHYQITCHTQREEQVFYARLEKSKLLSSFILHMKEDHFIIEKLLKELSFQNYIDKIWMRKFHKLYWILFAHAEFEEDQIFKMAKKILSKEDEEKLGRHLFILNIK
jgi:hemerythrin superfamily protein